MSRAVKFELDNRKMQDVVGRLTNRAMTRGADAAVSRAKQNAPVRTGNLQRSIIRSSVVSRGFMRWNVQIFTELPYAIYQEKGTRGARPVNAKVLRFKPKGSNTFVFAMKTGPVPATRFMERALNSVTTADFR